MIRLNSNNATFHGLFLALALTFIISSVALAQGQNGTTLLAIKTATGFHENRITYDWTIEKTADLSSVTLGNGESATIGYTISVTRTEVSNIVVYGVRGTISVTNAGVLTTENLKLVDQVEYKMPGPGEYQPLIGASQTIHPAELEPGKTGTYAYEITFTPVSGALYRNSVQVTITNHSHHLGEEFGPNPKAAFSLPAEPTIIETDESATITDVMAFDCQEQGFSQGEATQSWPLDVNDTAAISYTVGIENVSAACGLNCSLENTATLVEGDTGVERTASANVGINTTPCGVETCETAFAFGGEYAECFLDLGFSRWGWTNGPLAEGSYTFEIWAAAGQCDTSKGTLVGTLTVEYTAGTATVTYIMAEGFTLDETQLYVGNEILPRNNGEYTVAPGQYPYKDGASDQYIVEGLSGAIYVVAHAVVCGVYPAK